MKKGFITLSKRFLQHELIQGSSYLFIGTFIANILAFLFNLLVVRKLTPSMYGEYASLVSLFSLTVMPAGSLSTVIVRFATAYFANNQYGKAKKLYLQLLVFLILLSIGFVAVSILFSGQIQAFLRIRDSGIIVWIGIIIALSYISVVNTAFLQSILRFGFIAFITFLGSLLKLFGGYAFLSISLELHGIFLAIFISGLISYIISFFPLRFFLIRSKTSSSSHLGEIIKYALPASFTVLALSSLTSTDVILVKHFFLPSQAGIYAGLSLVGRIIFYLTIPISSVMFPLVVKRYHKGENVVSLLVLSLFLVLAPAIGMTLIYFFFPTFVIQFFLGGKGYLVARNYLGFFGIYMSLFSGINILTNFFLSLNKMKVTYVIGLGALSQIILISLFHSTIAQPIFVSIGISLVIFVLLLLYYVKTYDSFAFKKENKNISYSTSV